MNNDDAQHREWDSTGVPAVLTERVGNTTEDSLEAAVGKVSRAKGSRSVPGGHSRFGELQGKRRPPLLSQRSGWGCRVIMRGGGWGEQGRGDPLSLLGLSFGLAPSA